MSTDELTTALDLYKDVTSNLFTLWNVFAVISLAVIGYAWGEKTKLGGRGKLMVAAGFVAVAVGNFQSLLPDIQPQHNSIVGK